MKPYLSSVLILLSCSTSAFLLTHLHSVRKLNTAAGYFVSDIQTRESSESVIQAFLVTNGNELENEFRAEKLQPSSVIDNEQSQFFTSANEGQIDLLYDR